MHKGKPSRLPLKYISWIDWINRRYLMGAYIRYVDMKAAGKRINGIYIGHGYLLSDMR